MSDIIDSPALATVPSAQEMMSQINDVPQSETSSAIDAQTQQDSIAPQTQEEKAASNGIELANTPQTDEPIEDTNIYASEARDKVKKYFVKAIGIGLTFQGLYGIYKSVIFILVEYPHLEQQLVAHQITQSQVNDFGIKAIMMVISTVLSMFFAMRLTFLKTKTAKTLSTIIAVLLFISNAMIHDYFVSFNTSQIMVNFILSIAYKIQGAPSDVIENIPFLEETIEGTIDTVWYK